MGKCEREREREKQGGESERITMCPRYNRFLHAFVSRILKIRRTPV